MSNPDRRNRTMADAHKVLAHPLRVNILLRIVRGKASPNMLAQVLGVSLNTVAYHVRVLLKFNAVELVGTKSKRGATEHFYVANQASDVLKILLGSKTADKTLVSPEEFTKGLLKRRDVAQAIPVQLDKKGAKEVSQILAKLTNSLRVVDQASRSRLKEAGADPILLNIGVLAFF